MQSAFGVAVEGTLGGDTRDAGTVDDHILLLHSRIDRFKIENLKGKAVQNHEYKCDEEFHTQDGEWHQIMAENEEKHHIQHGDAERTCQTAEEDGVYVAGVGVADDNPMRFEN